MIEKLKENINLMFGAVLGLPSSELDCVIYAVDNMYMLKCSKEAYHMIFGEFKEYHSLVNARLRQLKNGLVPTKLDVILWEKDRIFEIKKLISDCKFLSKKLDLLFEKRQKEI